MDEALVLCRLLQFAAAMLQFGVSVFQSTLAPAALARALDRPLRRMSGAAILVVFVTTVGWLLLAAGEMGEGWADTWNPETIGAVLFHTEFGQVWLWRLGFAIVLLGVLAFGRHDRWPIVALLAALVLGSLGLVGHAVMQAGAFGWLNRLCHVIHLLAAGFWLGSLVPLIACLRSMTDQAVSANALVALRRFSALGHVAVATVLATGAINTWLVLGQLPINVSSPYQALLLAKISLVAIMLGLALVNRYVLVPHLRSAFDSLRLLRWSTIGEIILGLGTVGLVSIIGTLAPM
ncbi:putative copper resistance protein D [Rhizobiales bacterium GAS113]|nr:putative copper resistance protein D [Rhizobiales bacterium GAS113]